MEPPVSLPRLAAHSPAATAAAEPPELPPGILDKSHGLRVDLNALFSQEEPIANSSMFSRPQKRPPRDSSFSSDDAV